MRICVEGTVYLVYIMSEGKDIDQRVMLDSQTPMDMVYKLLDGVKQTPHFGYAVFPRSI